MSDELSMSSEAIYWLCGDCGTIANRDAYIPRPCEAEECPACGAEHSDACLTAGVDEGALAEMEALRERRVQEDDELEDHWRNVLREQP
jgi:hypothetical protein